MAKPADVASVAIRRDEVYDLKRLQLDAEQAAGRHVTLSEIIRRLIDDYRSQPGTPKAGPL